jgi:hypothetical protein
MPTTVHKFLRLGKEIIIFYKLDRNPKKLRKEGTKIASDLENTTREKHPGSVPIRTFCIYY